MTKTETIVSIMTQLIGNSGITLKEIKDLQAMLEQIGLSQCYEKYSETNSDKENVLLALDCILNDLYMNDKQDDIIKILIEIEHLINSSYVKKYLYNDFEKFFHLYRSFGLDANFYTERQELAAIQSTTENNAKVEEARDNTRVKDNEEDLFIIYNNALKYYVNGYYDICMKLCTKAIASAFYNCNDIDSFEKWLRSTFCNPNNKNTVVSDTGGGNGSFKKYFIAQFIKNNNERLTQSNLNHMIYLLILDCCSKESGEEKKKYIKDDAAFMLRLTHNILQWMF